MDFHQPSDTNDTDELAFYVRKGCPPRPSVYGDRGDGGNAPRSSGSGGNNGSGGNTGGGLGGNGGSGGSNGNGGSDGGGGNNGGASSNEGGGNSIGFVEGGPDITGVGSWVYSGPYS